MKANHILGVALFLIVLIAIVFVGRSVFQQTISVSEESDEEYTREEILAALEEHNLSQYNDGSIFIGPTATSSHIIALSSGHGEWGDGYSQLVFADRFSGEHIIVDSKLLKFNGTYTISGSRQEITSTIQYGVENECRYIHPGYTVDGWTVKSNTPIVPYISSNDTDYPLDFLAGLEFSCGANVVQQVPDFIVTKPKLHGDIMGFTHDLSGIYITVSAIEILTFEGNNVYATETYFFNLQDNTVIIADEDVYKEFPFIKVGDDLFTVWKDLTF